MVGIFRLKAEATRCTAGAWRSKPLHRRRP